VSEKHLTWLRQRGSRYIVGTPKNQLRTYERQLLKKEWSTIRAGLQVQLTPKGAGIETFILCRSEDRALKEQAMRRRFADRIELGLTKLTQACERSPQPPGVIERRIGRLLERNQRAARFYDIRVHASADDPNGAASVQWRHRDDAWQQACACD